MSIDTKSGLRIKPLYSQLIGTALSDDNRNIKFPNRDAKFLRNGFELSQLDGEGQRAMERQQQMAASENYKQSLIKQIAINSGLSASSLRTEVDSQNRLMGVQSMLSVSSPTTEHYDMDVADDEEVERQDKIDTIEREKRKQNAYTGLFQEEHTRADNQTTNVKEQASKIRELAEGQFAPSASSSGAGLGWDAENTSATRGRRRTRSRPAPGTDNTTRPPGRKPYTEEQKAEAKEKAKEKAEAKAKAKAEAKAKP
jgi:hypothetical protein